MAADLTELAAEIERLVATYVEADAAVSRATNTFAALRRRLDRDVAGQQLADALTSRAATIAQALRAASRVERVEARHVAVAVVDALRGYTIEFAHDPKRHRDEYGLAEIAVRTALSLDPAP